MAKQIEFFALQQSIMSIITEHEILQTSTLLLPYCNSSHFKVNTFLFSHIDRNHILAKSVFFIHWLLTFLVKILLCLQQYSTTLYLIYPIHSVFILYVKNMKV